MSGRRERKYEELHEQIINAGIELYGAVRASQVRVGAIAERADIAVATFYNHFDSVELFELELVAIQRDRVRTFTAHALGRSESATDAIATWIAALWAAAAAGEIDLPHAIRLDEGRIGELGELEEMISATIGRGIAAGEFSASIDVDFMAVLVRTVERGALRHRLSYGVEACDWKDVVYAVLAMLGVERDRATDAISAASRLSTGVTV